MTEPKQARSFMANCAYVAAAILIGVIVATARGANIATAEGAGYAIGSVSLGLIVGVILKLFRRPVDLPRWTFWGALLSLALEFLR